MRTAMLFLGLTLSASAADIAQGIRLIPFDEFPEMKTAAGMENYRHAYFVLANDSDRAVTALTVIWSYTSIETGQVKDGVVKTLDNYMLDKSVFRPLVAAQAQLQIGPSAAAVRYLADAKDGRITFTVDAIVFEDGEIVGADRYRIGEDIAERYEAAREVSSRFHLGAGKPLDRIADDVNAMSAANAARARWRGHFAGRVLATMRDPKLTAIHLKSLDTMAEPPKFWKKELSK